MKRDDLHKDPNFSLFLGGPLFQLLMRLKLTTPTLELLKRRIIFISLFAWLPLLILSFVDGKAWRGTGLPFLYDIETQLRFLVALPLLIGAELVVHKRLRAVVEEFLEQNIITQDVLPKFNAAIASALKLRNSVAAELFLLFLTFIGGHYLWSSFSITEKISSHIGTWYATAVGTETQLSPAGYWYVFISRPLFQFIGYRWYYRLFIWGRFLWQCSRLKLNQVAAHPDRAAGLEFLGLSSTAFAPLLMAHGVLLAGLIANRIFFEEAQLTDFMMLIFSVLIFLLLIVLGPLCVFAPAILSAKRTGLREYGSLASQYVREFDHKWLHSGATDAPLLGSPDIQSLADMGNSFQVVCNIHPFPFNKHVVFLLIALTLAPLLPLVLTLIPLKELVTKILTTLI